MRVAASFALAFNFASPQFALRRQLCGDAKLEAKQFDDKTRMRRAALNFGNQACELPRLPATS